MTPYQILICDDEQEIIDILKLYLQGDQMRVLEAYDGLEAWQIIQEEKVDLAIIDLMMPKLDGYQLIAKIREKHSFPCLILSAKTQLEDKLKGYDLGAIDYITKPFEPKEILAKVKALLNMRTGRENTIVLDEVTLDLDQVIIVKNEEHYPLTAVEFTILKMLMAAPKQVFTKAQLYEKAWQQDYCYDDNSLRVIMSRLRDKVGSEHIETIRGLGYRWKR